ncbi:MAG: hypothetical protein RSF78_09490 [Bacteroidales bacterium]
MPSDTPVWFFTGGVPVTVISCSPISWRTLSAGAVSGKGMTVGIRNKRTDEIGYMER